MRNRISFILMGLIVILLLGPDFSTWLQQGGLQFGQPFSYLEVQGLVSSQGRGTTIGVMPTNLLIDLMLGIVSFLLYMLWMFLRKKSV
ncbi:hypothetical protein [Olivibacter sp. XZL3]|uniref:hypothetical protein n=1 Tax=Olivibacter sp. XZL3 TaxID=1735116 RepID=UPI00106637D4|nr:hypothetical protein [Olivibacter sp. XZL3]